ncbi:MAG TPA: questin oxidase family protein, partial [Verrucomicrobiae bacterium]|nr:questin oxidase family protein [Verrucomicrobiae bacterium]
MKDYSMMEPALEFLAPYGPDLRNGLTSHAPMAVEALAAMGRADAVMPWLEAYRRGMEPRPLSQQPIGGDDWRAALGRTDRVADWEAFFAHELAEGPWREVLARWTARLAPGICASAMHGVIRVGHAARSLGDAETAARLRELADGLGYWAAAYQTLPTSRSAASPMRARAAIDRVPIVPPAQRKFSGTIVSSLAALDDFPDFAPVIGLLDVDAEPPHVISDLTETFARVYLANARDLLGAIVFIHGVTSATALRSILPYLADTAARDALRYAWQAGCALYSAFGTSPAQAGELEPPSESGDSLIDMAIANGDEHAIKFTEACLR